MQQHTDLHLNGRAKVGSYRAMLESLKETGLPSLTHRDAWLRQSIDDRYLCIRHDVDHDLEKALLMARIEHELDIRATYFLLPPGDYGKSENYYGAFDKGLIRQSDRLREVVLLIVSLGHEIGLHNDFLQLSRRLRRPLRELIIEQVAYFRSIGVRVTGSASHGSRFARAHDFRNYEVFAECFRANSQRRNVTFDNGEQFELYSVAMGELGLEYEAYGLKREIYISDTGTRMYIGREYYDSLQPTMFSDLVGSAAKVVALFHPEGWTALDPANPPRIPSVAPASVIVSAPLPVAETKDASADIDSATDQPIFRRSDGKAFRIAIRGDCCSRRAVVMNKALFPRGVEMIINEKCPNTCFVETLKGKGVSLELGNAVSNVGAMSGSLKHYYIGQFDRSVLDASDLDLLLIDSYSDMNFELWRHRSEGWSLWVHPKFLQKPDDFAATFEKTGYQTLEDAVSAICCVIDHVRVKNPGVAVVILNQPVEYYPKLDKRREFYRLGELVAGQRAGVYAAKPLTRDELTPADVGSCGPGLTLHFDGPTYLKMIEDAWRQGLGEHLRLDIAARTALTAAPLTRPSWFKRIQLNVAARSAPKTTGQSGPKSTPAAPPAPSVTQATTQASSPTPASIEGDDGEVPHVCISYRQGSEECLPTCASQVDAACKTFAQYFKHAEVQGSEVVTPRYTPMLISAESVRDFPAWEAHIKTFGGGARLRQKRKAIACGYYVKPFAWRLHIPDIHAVNHSKATRSGGAMRGGYLRTVDEMGGAPDRMYAVAMPRCPHHWALTFGAFVKDPEHKQGAIQVGERLLAYISLRRWGDVVLYSQILGHGDHLSNGILTLLHHEVVRWISENLQGHARDVRFIMYGGQQNGGESLLQFKRQAGFTAHHVLAYRAGLASIEAGTVESTEDDLTA